MNRCQLKRGQGFTGYSATDAPSTMWTCLVPERVAVKVVESNAWLIAFKACLEPGVARAFGTGWHLITRYDRGVITMERPGAVISVSLPRGCEAVSPLWVAQRIVEQLRQQAQADGLLSLSGSHVVANLAGRKQPTATP